VSVTKRARPPTSSGGARHVEFSRTPNGDFARRNRDAPGNVVLKAKTTGLPKDSVANVSQIVAIDRDTLTERVGKVRAQQLELIFAGFDLVLGR
jgi:mRNA-degrading endonuclease toxin of MazEF toxin-antitoxin module